MADRFPTATWLNLGVIGAHAMGTGCWYTGDAILSQALAAKADLVIIALGTNDLYGSEDPPEAVFEALTALAARSEATGIPAVIATIPPIFNDLVPGVNDAIDRTNALIEDGFTYTVNFHESMVAEDFAPDGVHIVLSGQSKRAAAVEALLLAR